MKTHHNLHKLSLAVCVAILGTSSLAMAQQDEDAVIEEVVATGSRLQGSATAVIEERKNQAFVADILGAEQISRTGDSDAASALRRVTGLTLVDGKFIYVRGLGQRYSSARLNGANVPSPDLSRNVVPLDIFPASIIESMAVQKAYSPNMPAAFGGGNIDIRTTSVPNGFTSGLEVSGGINTATSDVFDYNRDESALSTTMQDAIGNYRGIFSLANIARLNGFSGETAGTDAIAVNNGLLASLPRDYAITEKSAKPNYGVKFHIGNAFDEDVFGGKFGVLLSVNYDNKSSSTDKSTAVIAQDPQANCVTDIMTAEDVALSCYNTFKDVTTTTLNERLNSYVNVGYKLDAHSVSYTNIQLADNEDTIDVSVQQSPAGSSIFSILGNGLANRFHEFRYEERELSINQFIGQHTFKELNNLGLDWQYTRSQAKTDIPGSAKFGFLDRYTDATRTESNITGDDNRVIYEFTNMDDRLDSYGGNLSYMVFTADYEIEFKAGYDFTDRARYYTTSGFSVSNDSGSAITINDSGSNFLADSGYLMGDFITNNDVLVDFNEPLAPNADDYLAAQQIDAGYGMVDVIIGGEYRISGGLRWENFQQVAIGTSSIIFTQDDLNVFYDPAKVQESTINEDDVYGSLAFTYIGGSDYQVRASYGETIVRPDLREVVPVFYFDPLTDIRTNGNSNLTSSNIKNYDLRYEYYGDVGNNLSVGLFYKDITAPIETVLQAGDEDYAAYFINSDDATLIGVETEWLYGLDDVVKGVFTSGNITISESEVSIDAARAGNLTNTTRPLTGHSKYVVNLQLNYDSDNGEHSASLVYNVFGERITAAGIEGRGDALEQPFHSLDVVYSYYPDFNSQIKVKVQNLLGQDQEVTQSDIAVRTREVGTGISVAYKYDF